MSLQGSGAISLANLAAEFGDSPPYSMSEYYRGGALVPASIPYTATATEGPYYTQGATSWLTWYNGGETGNSAQWGGGSVADNIPAGTYSISIGGYLYYRSYYVAHDDKLSLDEYAIARNSYYTAYETVNTGIPGSGQISLNQFYGGRKT
jgi:hypothetical protein